MIANRFGLTQRNNQFRGTGLFVILFCTGFNLTVSKLLVK